MNETTDKIEHFQTVLRVADMDTLKILTDEKSSKEALSKAVAFTIKNMKSKKKAEKEA